MYLRLINVKAIERQRDSYILVINNRYEKMGESLYRINKDALEIIRNLNELMGTYCGYFVNFILIQ